jgi:hypothetical protein
MIRINNLPKISLNKWYAGTHWTARKKIKDAYKKLIKHKVEDGEYDVEYTFYFKSRPLDATNTIAMAKMIEDIIFENDSYKKIKSVTLKSRKSKNDYVEIVWK